MHAFASRDCLRHFHLFVFRKRCHDFCFGGDLSPLWRADGTVVEIFQKSAKATGQYRALQRHKTQHSQNRLLHRGTFLLSIAFFGAVSDPALFGLAPVFSPCHDRLLLAARRRLGVLSDVRDSEKTVLVRADFNAIDRRDCRQRDFASAFSGFLLMALVPGITKTTLLGGFSLALYVRMCYNKPKAVIA